MPTLLKGYLTLLLAFAPLFSKRIWNHVQILLVGAILVRYDKSPENYLGLIQFACALLWYRRLAANKCVA